MQSIDINTIPQIDIDMAYDDQDTGNQNVVHPIFIPILTFTVMIGA